jgi:flagellar basal-body rod modification protein FlgD
MTTSISSADSLLSRNQFLTLFAKQLQYQDPTSPMDTDSFLQQLAQLTTVEGIQNMDQGISNLGPKLDSLVASSSMTPQMRQLQDINAGTGLLGMSVRYGDDSGDVGVVSEIKPDNGQVLMRIGNSFYPISDVQSVAYDPANLSR